MFQSQVSVVKYSLSDSVLPQPLDIFLAPSDNIISYTMQVGPLSGLWMSNLSKNTLPAWRWVQTELLVAQFGAGLKIVRSMFIRRFYLAGACAKKQFEIFFNLS
jgi:hypothetical protein